MLRNLRSCAIVEGKGRDRAVFTKTTLRCEGASAAAARRFVADALLNRGFPVAGVEQAVLLTSEAVTCAIFHADAEVQLAVLADPSMARVEVFDGHAWLPTSPSDTPNLRTSFGLRIIETLAEAWGVEQLADGKRLWFEVRP